MEGAEMRKEREISRHRKKKQEQGVEYKGFAGGWSRWVIPTAINHTDKRWGHQQHMSKSLPTVSAGETHDSALFTACTDSEFSNIYFHELL